MPLLWHFVTCKCNVIQLEVGFVFHTYSRNVSFLTRLVQCGTHGLLWESCNKSTLCKGEIVRLRLHFVVNFSSFWGFYFCPHIFSIRFVHMVALASISNTRLWSENTCRVMRLFDSEHFMSSLTGILSSSSHTHKFNLMFWALPVLISLSSESVGMINQTVIFIFKIAKNTEAFICLHQTVDATSDSFNWSLLTVNHESASEETDKAQMCYSFR